MCIYTYFIYNMVIFMEKEMATHSSILAWRIPWREEPGRLQSMGLQRVGHNWATSLSLSLYYNLGEQNFLLFLKIFLFYTGVQLINNVVFQAHSRVIQLCMYLFQILFSFRLLQNIKQSSLCSIAEFWNKMFTAGNIRLCVCTSRSVMSSYLHPHRL